MTFTAHLHLVQRLRMSGAIPLLHLYAFMDYTETTLLFTVENDRYREGNNVKEVLSNNIPEILWHCETVNLHVNFNARIVLLLLFCIVTNKCTIVSHTYRASTTIASTYRLYIQPPHRLTSENCSNKIILTHFIV